MNAFQRAVRVLDLACAGILVACSPASPMLPAPHAAAPASTASGPLRFALQQGSIRNYFVRQGDVAAHVVVTSGHAPRVVLAFPAGDAGIGLWLDAADPSLSLTAQGPVTIVHEAHGMRGVSVVLHASTPALYVHTTILSSIRVLRQYVATHKTPSEVQANIRPGPPVLVHRTTLDGKHHMALRLESVAGSRITVHADGSIGLAAAPGASSFAVRLTALHDDPPLTPVPLNQILASGRVEHSPAFDALAFLSYRQKLLAGSWRFLTYFGRDTLMSVRLLLPTLAPPVIEGGLRSVLARLSPRGEVAHEEAIGEYAALLHLRAGEPVSRKPVYDYKMIDSSFMLAPVIARYLLDTATGRRHATAFLDEPTGTGSTLRQALEKNLRFVLASAAPFAKTPSADHLIGLKLGHVVGDWRDSQNCGIGGGKYPFSVNVALVPAALRAAARLYASPLLPDAEAAAEARREAAAWQQARRLFRVEVPATTARLRLTTYAHTLDLHPPSAGAHASAPVSYWALSLEADGKPVPVMHSDDAFTLLFSDPAARVLDAMTRIFTTPFPAGLWTPVGIVVANAGYSGSPRLEKTFSRAAYHGAVVWSWQQAMLAVGLARQLRRPNLPAATRRKLQHAQSMLWQVIHAAASVRTAELWTWRVKHGTMVLAPFGQGRDDEANAAQLWSTVFLALPKAP